MSFVKRPICTYILGQLLGGKTMEQKSMKKERTKTTLHLLLEDKEKAFEKAESLGRSFSVYISDLIRADTKNDKKIEY